MYSLQSPLQDVLPLLSASGQMEGVLPRSLRVNARRSISVPNPGLRPHVSAGWID